MDIRDDKGNTVLHHAAYMNNQSVLMMSVKKAEKIIYSRGVDK